MAIKQKAKSMELDGDRKIVYLQPRNNNKCLHVNDILKSIIDIYIYFHVKRRNKSITAACKNIFVILTFDCTIFFIVFY